MKSLKFLFVLFIGIYFHKISFAQSCLPSVSSVNTKDIWLSQGVNCIYLLDKINVEVFDNSDNKICGPVGQKRVRKIRFYKDSILNSFINKDFSNTELIESIRIDVEGFSCGYFMNLVKYKESFYIHEYEEYGENLSFNFEVNSVQELDYIEIAELECFFSQDDINSDVTITFTPFIRPWGTIFNNEIVFNKLDSFPLFNAKITLLETGETTYSDQYGNFYFCNSDPKVSYTMEAEYDGFVVWHNLGPADDRCETFDCKFSIHERLQNQIDEVIGNFNDKIIPFSLTNIDDLDIPGYSKIRLNFDLNNNYSLYSDVDLRINNTAVLYAGLQPFNPFLEGYIKLNDAKSKAILEFISQVVGLVDYLKVAKKIIKKYNESQPTIKVGFDYDKTIKKLLKNVEKFTVFCGMKSEEAIKITEIVDQIIKSENLTDVFFTDLIHQISSISVQGIYINGDTNVLLEEMFSSIISSKNMKNVDAVIDNVSTKIIATELKVDESYQEAVSKISSANTSDQIADLSDLIGDLLVVVPGGQQFALIAQGISKFANIVGVGLLASAYLGADDTQDEIRNDINKINDFVVNKNIVHSPLNASETELIITSYSLKLDTLIQSLRNNQFSKFIVLNRELNDIDKKLDTHLDSLVNTLIGVFGKNSFDISTMKSLENLLFKSGELRMQLELFSFSLPFESTQPSAIDNFESICNNIKQSNLLILEEIGNFSPTVNNIGHAAFLNVTLEDDVNDKNIKNISMKIRNFGSQKLNNVTVLINGSNSLEISNDSISINKIEPMEEVDVEIKCTDLSEDSLDILVARIIYNNQIGDIEFIPIVLTDTELSGVNNENNSKVISVTPNPTTGNIIVKTSEINSDVSYIEIRDNSGALIKNIYINNSLNEINISLQEFPAGLYTLYLFGPKGKLLSTNQVIKI